MLGVSETFNKALVKVAGALAIKIGVLHVLTARSRVMSGNASSGRPMAWEEDAKIADVAKSAFKVLLGAYGPTISTERLVGVVHNAVENEPFFLALGAAVAIAGNPPAWGATALYAFCIGRFAHMAIFITEVPESVKPYKAMLRAVPFLVGVFSMISLAGASIA
ncbi:hypothetical protein AB1Y20_019016 [Prymnesium parvum]|uniref:Glutathione transferase n=1 Tax=Prymnesium parvum TaxID=97485 RepID=A0AB34JQ96_PRYPA|mmetsp:Transcript_24772/g.61450  ORF Transcript_24772/g.61450 Transcript_24772/m.61450 type:complete len:164 (+) Transcript_24772:54-545(+)